MIPTSASSYICNLITSPMRFLFEPDNASDGCADSFTRSAITSSHEIPPPIIVSQNQINKEIQKKLIKPYTGRYISEYYFLSDHFIRIY